MKNLADGGDATACLKLGLAYYEGDEVSQDSKEAYTYFCKAEEAGNALAAYYAGLCCYYGQGAEVSDHKAHALFEKAAKGGCEQAVKALASLPFHEHELIVRAMAGDDEACCILGDSYHRAEKFYDRDLWVDEAYKRAVEWYEIAAERGDPNALHWLGYIYYYGWAVGRNDAKSKEYYNRTYECAKKALAEDSGNAYAKFWLGKCLANGYGCNKDEKKGIELIAEAAEAGLEAALFVMAGEYAKEDKESGDGRRVRGILEKLGENGDAEIKYQVARYYRGSKICLDRERADYWFERAAEEGSVPAMLELANCYSKAAQGEKDNEAAREKFKKSYYWFERAVENQYVLARYELGSFYYEGTTGEKDYARATEILLPVAKCTHGNKHQIYRGAVAARMIGDIYSSGGFGVERDEKRAFNWYLSAASRESMVACTKVGNAYFYGIGTKQDYASAVYWYEQAIFDYDEQMFYGSEKGYDYGANVGLGDCYRLGLGVEKDEDEAFHLYDDVSKYTDDCPAADERVARCYYFGIGVEKDEKQARGFWENAANHGDEDAKAALKKYFPDK